MCPQSSSRAAGVLVVAALIASGCNGPPSAPGGAPPSASAAPLVVADVLWPDPSSADRAALAALPARAAERVQASQVPVLLPPRAEWLASAGVATKPLWTTASMRADGATITVTASRGAHRVPGVEPARGDVPIRDTFGFVTQNEGIWSVSWIENGVAYSVEVECGEAGDARCADAAFALDVARGLVFVGGAGAGEP